jgi:hypothetical protein
VALTGLPLLVLAVVASLSLLYLTIRYWSRGVVVRVVAILCVEALVLFTAGLVVNRAFDDLFPSWTALLHQDTVPAPAAQAATPARLDGWLRGRDSRTFAWTPAGERFWPLAQPPTVVVPAAYLSLAAQRFPVVVVVSPDPPEVVADPPTPAVLVWLRADRIDADFLTRTLPAALESDLRVTSGGWAAVGIGTDCAAGLDALAKDSARYRSAAAVGTLPAPDRPGAFVTDRLSVALQWVYAHLPAPLAAPLSTGTPTGPVPVPRPAASR